VTDGRGDGRSAAAGSLLLTILDGLPVVVMLRAADGTLLHINPAGLRFVERLGVGVGAVAPSPASLLEQVEVIDEDGMPYRPAELPVVAALRDGAPRDATLGYALPGGERAWYAVRAAPVPLGDGTVGTVVTCDDVTERQEARHRVAVAERSLRRTFERAPIGIAVVAPDGVVVQVNAALCDLLGRDEQALLGGGLRAATHPDDRAVDERELATWLAGTADRHLVDRRFVHADGSVVHAQLSVAVVPDDDGTPLHLIVQVVDLTRRLVLEQELRAAAVEDPLTGLANRRALAEHLVEAQRRRARNGAPIGLVYLDLDRFKAVNDAHGHDVGDAVLVAAGRRLLAATRAVDTVCRLGGDEFVVLCAPVGGEAGLHDLVHRLTVGPPVATDHDGVPVEVTWSVGAALVEPGDDLDAALRRADAEMYRAKRAGGLTGDTGG
jgi:diguanylate cyclase (GGDEF)-like protein/PAS domain S-box-containing protein